MSDAEDGFDREAEKERLREKYEAEKADREATQHMSELLLKGATMTNKHCEECGNPVFRYEGQEFCPVCGEGAGAAGDGAERQDESGGQGGAAGDGSASAEPTPSGDEQAGAGGPADRRAPGGTVAGEDRGAGPAEPGTRPAAAGRAPGEAAGQPSQPAGQPSRPAGTDEPTGATAGDLGEARASLVRTLTRLAREAESSQDAGHARDLLAAAREAAEALAALSRVGRE